MSRPIDENDLNNAMDLLRQEMGTIQDKALKLVDKKMGTMITEKATSVIQDVMVAVDAKQQKMMKTIEAKFNAVENTLTAKIRDGDDKLGDRIDDTNKHLKEFRREFHQEVGRIDREMQAMRDNVRQTLESFKKAVDDSLQQISEAQEQTIEHVDRVETTLKDGLDDMAQTKASLNHRLDGLITYQKELEQDLFACENMAAKRVEWEISEAKRLLMASRRIALASAQTQGIARQSFFSPPFAAAGIRNLQIEMSCKFKPAISQREDEVHIGEVSLFLWAPRGTQCSFRLYLNERVRSFEFDFPSRQACGGSFGDIDIPVKDDLFKMLLTVEVTEAKVVHVHEIAPYVPNGNQEGVACAGSLFFSRHVNHRLLDQVKQQVEIIRSRLLKRVEWRIENADRLQKDFGYGEALLSPFFAVAGIDRLRFQFFPSGYLNPEEHTSGAVKGYLIRAFAEGLRGRHYDFKIGRYCSLFLHCPAGTTINGCLNIDLGGNLQKRPIEHTYAEAGSFGRTLFCRYAIVTGVNPDNSITISLDINSASQEVSSINNDPDEHGVLKLVRGLEGNSDLSEIRVLPTVWSRYNQHGSKLHMSEPTKKPAPPAKRGKIAAGLSSMFGGTRKKR